MQFLNDMLLSYSAAGAHVKETSVIHLEEGERQDILKTERSPSQAQHMPEGHRGWATSLKSPRA
jgi:hypothetical protein